MTAASTSGPVSGSALPLDLFAAFAVTLVAQSLALTYLVYSDARARGDERPIWWLIRRGFVPYVLTYYVWSRRRIGPRDEPLTGRERLAVALALLPPVAGIVGALVAPAERPTLVFLVAAVGGTVPLFLVGAVEAAARTFGPEPEETGEGDRASPFWPPTFLPVLSGLFLVAFVLYESPEWGPTAVGGALVLVALFGGTYAAVRLVVGRADEAEG